MTRPDAARGQSDDYADPACGEADAPVGQPTRGQPGGATGLAQPDRHGMDPGRRARRAHRPLPRRALRRRTPTRHDLRLAYAGAQSKRSVQTVSPLAARLGLVVITRFGAGDEIGLAREISSRPGGTRVAWHHETIHEIAHHLGQVEPTPPGHWPHDRFDMIWTFTPGQHGWRFTQVPQLLLPGDLPYLIELTPRTPS